MLQKQLALFSAFPLLVWASEPIPPAVQQIEKQGVKIIREVKTTAAYAAGWASTRTWE